MAKEKLQTTVAIGALIRRTRKQQGVSQAVLVGLSMVGTRFISNMRNGKKPLQPMLSCYNTSPF